MKEFRITVQLGNFFQDHRREARIFITKHINTIADLEKHITEVFSIRNFYLTCQNHLLPSTEDIRVLQEDETVWYVITYLYAAKYNTKVIKTILGFGKTPHKTTPLKIVIKNPH